MLTKQKHCKVCKMKTPHIDFYKLEGDKHIKENICLEHHKHGKLVEQHLQLASKFILLLTPKIPAI